MYTHAHITCVVSRALNGSRYTDVKLVKEAPFGSSSGEGRVLKGWKGESGRPIEGWIYPGGGSKLHFPGHEWQINKQFAFAGREPQRGGPRWGGEKQPPAHTQTPRGESERKRSPRSTISPHPFPWLVFAPRIFASVELVYTLTQMDVYLCIYCIYYVNLHVCTTLYIFITIYVPTWTVFRELCSIFPLSHPPVPRPPHRLIVESMQISEKCLQILNDFLRTIFSVTTATLFLQCFYCQLYTLRVLSPKMC